MNEAETRADHIAVGLAAVTLLVAESDPREKEIIIRLIENLLAKPG